MLPCSLHPQQNIAIIGAGVSGLLLARALSQRGYRNVTLFEAGSTVAGSTVSQRIDGRVYDFATKFVPADTILSPGCSRRCRRCWRSWTSP